MKRLITFVLFLFLTISGYCQFPETMYAELHPLNKNYTRRADLFTLSGYDNNQTTSYSNDTVSFYPNAGFTAEIIYILPTIPTTYETYRFFQKGDICEVRFKIWDTLLIGNCEVVNVEMNEPVVTVTVLGVRKEENNSKLLVKYE